MSLLIWCKLYAWLLIRIMPYSISCKNMKMTQKKKEEKKAMRAGLGARKQTSMKGRVSQVHVRFSMMFSSSVCGCGGYQPIRDMPTAPQLLNICGYKQSTTTAEGVKEELQPGHTLISGCHLVHTRLCKCLSEFTLGLIWQERPSLEWLWMQNGNYS